MVGIKVDSVDLTVQLQGLKGAVEDLRPAWPEIHTIFTDFMKTHFESEGSYVGDEWVPLSPRYAEWKKRNYPGKGILHLTERLYPSLVDKEHEEHFQVEGPDFAEYGTTVVYAWAHQKGRPEINLPARTVIPQPTKAEGERIVDVILAYLLKVMRWAGSK